MLLACIVVSGRVCVATTLDELQRCRISYLHYIMLDGVLKLTEISVYIYIRIRVCNAKYLLKQQRLLSCISVSSEDKLSESWI